jgi:hypothetical protein
MRDALKELRKIIQMPDQKHWNYVEMRERALEEWINAWIIQLDYEQSVLDQRYLNSEFEDFLKEHIGNKLTDQAMESAVDITTEKTRIKGSLTCVRRKPRV